MAEQIGLSAVMDLSDFNRGVDRYLDAINRMERETDDIASSVFNNFQNLGAVVAGVGATLVATVGAATALAVREFGDFVDQSINDAMSLQDQMAEIGAVLGLALDEVEPLRQAIQDLAIDPNLKVTTFEAADAIEQLAKNGLAVTVILDNAAKATIALANAAGGDFGQAADVVTDVLNIFGEEVGDATNAVNQITAVINNSKFNLNDYQLALSNAGQIAQTVGISFEDLNAGLIAVSSAYNTGRRAGTGFSNALLNFVPKSKQAAELMAALGLVTEEGIIKFYDAEGSFLGLENAAQALQDSFGGLSEAERNFFIRQIFGIEALESVIRLMELGADGIAKVKLEMGEVDAFKAAETRMKTLAGAVEVLNGIFEAMRINFAYKALPALEKGVRAINKTLEENFDSLQGMGDVFALLIGNIVDAAIPLIEEWIPKFIDASVKLAGWLSQLIQTGELFGTEFDKLPIPIQRIITFMTNAWRAILKFVDQMKVFVDQVVLIIRPIWEWIAANIELEDVIIGLALGVLALIAPLTIAIVKFGVFVTALFVGIHKIREAWENDWGGIQGFTREVVDRLLTMGETLVEILTTLFDRFGESGAEGLEKAFIAVQPIILGLLGVAQKVLDLLLMVVQGRWREAWAEIQQIAADAIDQIPVILQQVWGYLKPILDRLVEYIVEKFNEIDWAAIWEQVKVYAKIAFDYLIELFKSVDWAGLWEQVKKYAKLAFDYLVDLFYSVDWAGIWDTIKIYAKKTFDYLVELFRSIDWKEIWGRIVEFLTPYLDWLKQKWEETWTWIEEKAGDTWGELIHNLRTGEWKAAWENIKDIAIDAWTKLSNFILTHDWWSEIAKVLGNEFTYGTLKPLYDIIVGVAKALLEGASQIIDWIGTWLSVEDTIVFITALIHEAVVAWLLFHGTIVAKAALITLAFHVLRDAWETNWGGIRDFTQGVWDRLTQIWALGVELIQTIWGNFGVSLEDTAINAFKAIQDVVNFGLDLIITLLESGIMAANGDWEGAWNHLAEFIEPVWQRIKETVVQALIDIGNFIKGLDWAAIWQTVQDIAVFMWNGLWDFLEAISTEKWAAIIASARAGDWQPVWDEVKRIANVVLDEIVAFAGGPDGAWGRMIQALRDGDWSSPWAAIKTIFNTALDEIVLQFGGETTGWGRLITDLREGKWAEAWIEIKAFANTAMDEIVKYFGGETTGWGKLITDLRAGDWVKVWADIVVEANKAMDEIVKYFGGETTGVGRLITDLRTGDWKGAWAEIVALATPAWIVIRDWALARWGEILVYLEGVDWAAVWSNLVTHSTIIWTAISIFAIGKWKEILSYLESVDWNAIFLTMFTQEEIDTYIAPVLASIKTAVDEVKTAIGALRDSFISGDAGGMGLLEAVASFITLIADMGTALGMAGQVIAALNEKDYSKAQETAKALWAFIESTKTKGTGLAPFDFGLFTTEDAGNLGAEINGMASDVQDAFLGIEAIIQKHRAAISVEFVSTQNVMAIAGTQSMDELARAIGNGQDQAEAQVQSLVWELTVLASAIKYGFIDAGDASIYGYIDALIAKRGLAEDEAREFSYALVDAVATGLIDNGTIVPRVLGETVVDPIKAKTPEAAAAGTALGAESVLGMGAGVMTESPSFMEIINGLYADANAAGAFLPTNMFATGAESVTQLGSGATSTGPTAVEAYLALVDQAIATGQPLPPEYLALGAASMTQLGTGVSENQAQAIEVMTQMVEQAMRTGEPLPPEFFEIGTQAIAQLATGGEGSQAETMRFYEDMISAAMETGTPLPPEFTDIGEKAISGMGTAISDGTPLVVGAVGEISTSSATALHQFEYILFLTGQTAGGLLATRLSSAAREMLPTAFTEINTVVIAWGNAFMELMLQAGKDGINALVMGIMSAVSSVDTSALRTLGENVGQSFADGVASKIGEVQAKANELVAAAAAATTAAAQIASPSKVFKRLGLLSGEGYLVGLNEMFQRIPQMVSASLDLVRANSAMLGQNIQRVAPAVSPIPSYNTSSYSTSVQNSFGPINVQDPYSEQVFINRVRRVVDDYVN